MVEPEAVVESATLEDIAMLAMEFGRIMMECGSSASIVEEYIVRRPGIGRPAGGFAHRLRLTGHHRGHRG